MKDLSYLSDQELEQEIEDNKTFLEKLLDKDGYRRQLAEEKARRNDY